MPNKKNTKKQSGLELVVMRNMFYRDCYYSTLFAVFLLIVVNVGLASMLCYKWLHPAQAEYFATNEAGQIIRNNPLSDPSVPNNFVLQWTTSAIRKSFNWDFVHWREQLQNAQDSYTSVGWKQFIAALKKSNDLNTLINLKMVSDLAITSPPQVVAQQVVDGHYAWNIQETVLLTFTNKDKTIHQAMTINVLVLRMPVEYFKDKIAIRWLNLKTVNMAAYSG